ncbi:DUF1700 domain-containing protein [Mesoplasma photuris]|uniref:DUF1700 domain-containing protein n=1 Tax=Mesoplasma photuris TaxID=217731 RepID=UPI0004E277C1|nr:DUF1700 domain-containing protein [Mesoplasma photuris]
MRKIKKRKKQWLAGLSRSLKLLSTNDKKDIIDAYSERIDIELAEGQDIESILARLESHELISKNIYEEFGIDRKTKIVKENKKGKTTIVRDGLGINRSFWAGFINIFLVPIGVVLPMLLAAMFFLIVIGLCIVLIPAIVLSFINFEISDALPLAFAFLGLIPLVAIICWFLFKGSVAIGGASINGMFMTFGSDKRFLGRLPNERPKKNKVGKWILICLAGLSIASATGGTLVTIAPKDSIVQNLINREFDNHIAKTFEGEELGDVNLRQMTGDVRYSNFRFDNTPFGYVGSGSKVIDYRKFEKENEVKPVKKMTVEFHHYFKDGIFEGITLETIKNQNNGSDTLVFGFDYFSWTAYALSFGPIDVTITLED